MSDPSEAFKALRTALLGDTTLTAMLGDNEAIFFSFPQVKTQQLPILDFILRGMNPQGKVSKTGLWRPVFDVKTVAADLWRCHGIVERLASEWTIPTERSGSIDSINFSITEISWGQTVQVGSGKWLNTNQPAYLLNTELTLRVVRTS